MTAAEQLLSGAQPIRHHRHLALVDLHAMFTGHEAEWTQWMRAAGLSARTVDDRVQLLARFHRATGVAPHLAEWNDLADFLADAPSAGTRYTYFAHLRAWHRWLVLMDHRLDDPTIKLRKPKVPRRKPRPVSIAQLARMLSTRMHRRTRLMILLGAYEGLRVSEIAAVRSDDFDGDDLVVTGKGGRVDTIPVHPLIRDALGSMPRRGWWFPSHTRPGEHARGNSVSTIIKQVMQRAGVPGTPHALRHFFGTHVLRTSGGNLVVAQQLMRHASAATTVMYTEVDDEARRAALTALPVPPTVIDGGA